MKGFLSFGVLEDLWYDRKKNIFIDANNAEKCTWLWQDDI